MLLIVFIITTIASGGFIVYDKFLKEEPKNNVENEKINNESEENKQNTVLKLNQEKDWIYDAEYEKNVNCQF